MVEAASDNTALVRSFCEAFSRADIDEILGFFAPDATYHNIPVDPAVGSDAIRATLEMFLPGAQDVEFEVLTLVASADVVVAERIDRMTIAGRRVELPVCGVFEISEGRITAWRDYFDMASFLGS